MNSVDYVALRSNYEFVIILELVCQNLKKKPSFNVTPGPIKIRIR